VENVDTDQIIPARFLKRIDKDGWGEALFRDWRYEDDDASRPVVGFPLNDPRYEGSVLVAGKNFGCGSSREHAVWALLGDGFTAVISSMFADIFRNNALNNFLLPVQVSEGFLQRVFDAVEADPKIVLEIDLDSQRVSLPDGSVEHFPIDGYKKSCLMNGYDDIDYLRSLAPEIKAYELEHESRSLNVA
jgi:3-isopropylmalate/(R)-2-methylmalate dehydratase small subunit